MEVVENQGSPVMLDHLGQYITDVPDEPGQKELHELREYIAKRISMTDYPSFLKLGYDIPDLRNRFVAV